MAVSYSALAEAIRNCAACSFREPTLQPLAPELPDLPVAVMFLGENPSWAKEQATPLAGTTPSGKALDEYYLKPLGLSRKQVWVTDLFKCPYPKAVLRAPGKYKATTQAVVNTCACLWLMQEIALAQPKVLVTLSDEEVYQRLRKAFRLHTPETFAAAAGKPHKVVLAGVALTLFPMVHPNVGRPLQGEDDTWKRATRRKWAPLHAEEHIPALRELLGLAAGR